MLFNYPMEKAPVDLVLNIAVNSLVSGPGVPLFGASALPPPRLIMPEFFEKPAPPPSPLSPLNSPVQTFKGAVISSPGMTATSATSSSGGGGGSGSGVGAGGGSGLVGTGEKDGDNFSLRTLHRNFSRRPSHKKHVEHVETYINEEIASLSDRIVSLETNNIHQSTRIERVLVLLQSNPEFKKDPRANEIVAELEDIKASLLNPQK